MAIQVSLCSYFYGGGNVRHHTQNVQITPRVPGGIDHNVPVHCGRVSGIRVIARGRTEVRYNRAVTIGDCGPVQVMSVKLIIVERPGRE